MTDTSSIFDPAVKRRHDALWSMLILGGFALALFGMALALGTEPRMRLERTGEKSFRVTGSNHFSGVQFFSRTIEGAAGYRHADGSRNRRGDSVRERQRQAARKRLAFTAADGWDLSWRRTDDWRVIDEYMRGDVASLELAEPPPRWRMALAWFCAGFAGLTFVGAIRNSFFPKKGTLP